MEKRNRKIKLVVIGILLLILGIIIIGIINLETKKEDKNKVGEQQNENVVTEGLVQILDDGSKLNVSTKLNQTREVDGLEIGNIRLTMVGGITTLTADVKNTTTENVKLTEIDIILYDENEQELITLGGVIGDVNAGESVKLKASTTLDFANAYDFKIVKK